jgi:hypothetical protein
MAFASFSTSPPSTIEVLGSYLALIFTLLAMLAGLVLAFLAAASRRVVV